MVVDLLEKKCVRSWGSFRERGGSFREISIQPIFDGIFEAGGDGDAASSVGAAGSSDGG